MDLESLMAIFTDFDLAAFLPELDSIVGWVEMGLRIAIMAGPLTLLGFGLLYLIAPPAEANHSLGYRFWWSMASLDAWQFTHRLAGIIWSALGLLLSIIMAFVCNALRRMEPMDMVWSAVTAICWQIGLAIISCIAIDVVVVVIFDKDGFRRKEYTES